PRPRGQDTAGLSRRVGNRRVQHIAAQRHRLGCCALTALAHDETPPAGSAFALAGLRGSDWSAVGRLVAERGAGGFRKAQDGEKRDDGGAHYQECRGASPVRCTSQVAASGVMPPIVPSVML